MFRCLVLLPWERTSGKGAMRAIVGSNLYCSLLNSKYPLMCIVGKQQKHHTPRSLNYCFFANEWALFFAVPFLANKGFALNGPFEDCQVRMFVKQRALPSANVFEAVLNAKCECFWNSQTPGYSSYLLLKIKQFCSSWNRQHCAWCFTLIFYPHHTGMRSEMLYTNGSFEICQERMFVKQRQKKRLKHWLAAETNIYTQAKIGQISTRHVLTP